MSSKIAKKSKKFLWITDNIFKIASVPTPPAIFSIFSFHFLLSIFNLSSFYYNGIFYYYEAIVTR